MEESKINPLHCRDSFILLVCEMCAFVKYVSTLESFKMKGILERAGKALL